MEPATLDHFKKRLDEMAAELQASLGEKKDDTAAVQVDTSIGRISRIDAIQSQQMALGLKARQQQALARVRSAQEAVRNGTYGICRRCKGPIAAERLEAQPDALLCVKCASEISKR